MTLTMKTVGASALSLFLLATGASAQAPPKPVQPTKVPAAAPAAAAPTAPNRAEAQREDLTSRIWWNQPKKFEPLGLSKEQRTRMDTLLKAYFDARAGDSQRRQAAMDGLGAALGRGDAAAAQSQGAVVADLTAEPIRAQVKMMVDVIGILTPKQRQTLAETFPRLLSSLWVRTAQPMGGAGRAPRAHKP